MASSSEGSAQVQLPASSGGSAASTGGCPSPPPPEAMLVSKVLTYSDVSTEVARTGRIVLPRIQVQQCLPELLRLCQAEHALPAVRSGGPVKLSVDLVVEDEAGRTWVVLMKTWQNVVSGEHRPTFVLENTADFVRTNQLVQGDTLAFCPHHGRMLLRTSLRADQLLPRNLKRSAGGASAPAAKRRPGVRSPPAASTPEPPAFRHAAVSNARRRKAPAPHDAQPAPFWQPSPAHAAEAAQALLDILHSAGSSQDGGAASSDSEQAPLSAPTSPSPVASSDAAAAAAAAAVPLNPATGSPAPSAMLAPHPIYRPHPVHSTSYAAGSLQQQLQQQERQYCPDAVAAEAAAALAASQQEGDHLLPSPLPLRSSMPAQQQYAPASGALPPEALAQAHSWLAAILAQQEQERRWVAQCNQLLLLQALQQEQAQAQRRYLANLNA